MKYAVVAVEDDALPNGMHQVIVERVDAPPLLLINGPVARCWGLMREFEGAVEPAWQPTVAVPLRLVV